MDVLSSKVFICHYTPLSNRKTYLVKKLDELGFRDITWMTENDVGPVDAQKVYDGSQEAFDIRAALGINDKGKRVEMRSEVVELNLQHIACYESILASDQDFGIVFEDDVIFKKDFSGKLQSYFDELPADWDVFYFGKGGGNHRSKMSFKDFVLFLRAKKHSFRQGEHKSRFTDSYLIRKKALEKILPTIIPFHYPIDWELNYQQKLHELNIYWGEPTLTKQGSKYGEYGSNFNG